MHCNKQNLITAETLIASSATTYVQNFDKEMIYVLYFCLNECIIVIKSKVVKLILKVIMHVLLSYFVHNHHYVGRFCLKILLTVDVALVHMTSHKLISARAPRYIARAQPRTKPRISTIMSSQMEDNYTEFKCYFSWKIIEPNVF